MEDILALLTMEHLYAWLTSKRDFAQMGIVGSAVRNPVALYLAASLSGSVRVTVTARYVNVRRGEWVVMLQAPTWVAEYLEALLSDEEEAPILLDTAISELVWVMRLLSPVATKGAMDA